METIQLSKAIPELGGQLNFLIKREFFVTYNRYYRLIYYVPGLTLVTIGLSALSGPDSLIALKVVLIAFTAIVWVATLIFVITILIKLFRRISWKQRTIKLTFLHDLKFQFAFDEERLYFFSDTYNTDIKWEYYKYYALDNYSIFIFPADSVYDALYYSQNELGFEKYELLKAIAATKLVLLAKKACSKAGALS